ncbi:MAG: YqeG family HAD IIIA-type phosphatase [Fimbriimonadaceae bacterium]|nr:YqeG family HAD IIIA-type phosphatase [Fimbriimonadaceae bacterium]
MKGFKIGKYAKERMRKPFRALCPIESVDSILSIKPEDIAASGKKLVLLDVDNTLLPWKSEVVPPATLEWIASLKALDINLCILSNTRHPDRLQRLSKLMDIPFIRGRFKPNPTIYRQALQQFNAKPEEAIMIGDQLFTDVLGASRAGIDAIWVLQMAPREFPGTKISRLGERIVRRTLYRAMHPPTDPNNPPTNSETEILGSTEGNPQAGTEDELDLMPSEAGAAELLKRPIVRQFAKFCIVGGLSFAIDYCIRMTMLFAIPYQGGLLSDVAGQTLIEKFPNLLGGFNTPKEAFYPIVALTGGAFGMINSFLWNRRWTFRIKGRKDRLAQLRKFFVISCIGWLINVVISSALNHAIPGDEKMSARIAIIVATGIAAFWNFFGQRLYAFKKKE